MDDRLCLLCVHAHPDDEASKGASTVAAYHAQGVHTVLVCCTGGEEGDILNPAMDIPDVRQRLSEVRMEELARSVEIIGYDQLVMLGYRDSGMPETPANARPDCFARAPLEEAVGRLVEVIRRTRPQVIITYADDQTGYPHPDHLRVHEISVIAFDAAGDPGAYPELGEPWSPSKMYYNVWSRARTVAMHEKFLELGLESPYDERWLERPSHDHRITTVIDISGHTEVRSQALMAHATQVDPNSKFWFGLPPEVARTVHPVEEFILARSRVGGPVAPDADSGTPEPDGSADAVQPAERETDLFAGVADLASR
ncbi:MAG TPA: mycothiol conjugate amidase Mca [Acidimicrobiales bacterium]|nr:mycothiol conjugate amidase Mca [Acidimicrobiales bacterium]